MKKVSLVLLIFVLVSFIAIANGTNEKQEDKVTIEVNIVQSDWLDAWDVMEERFEAQYPNINVESVGVGVSNSDFFVTRQAAGDIPELLQVDSSEVFRAGVEAGQFEDLSNYEVTKYIGQGYIDSFTYNDVLFGITQGAAFSVLYLNMAILEEAGWTEAPKNWNEFINCCKDIKEKTSYSPLTLAGDKTTTCWMLYESIIANVVGDELGFGGFEKQMLNGTFDFTAYPEIEKRLQEVAPYLITGTSMNTEDDVTALMADGSVAMCLAGNWTANNICSAIEESTESKEYVKAILAPFNDKGKDAWISVSPETAFGMSADNSDPKIVEAKHIFFNWLFQPENFMLIQNARGTVPVLTNMKPEQIKLPDAISAIVPAMNAAQYVKMGFNLWTTEFRDAACTALKDVYSGNLSAKEAVESMTRNLKRSHINN